MKTAKRPPRKAASRAAGPALEFNHAMIYVTDVDRSLAFYRDALGFVALEIMAPFYARLRSPRGMTTIALHKAEPGHPPDAPGMRLYFEVERVAAACKRLAARGVVFTKMPAKMPWGWVHAYLNDPDGREISLYWAGAKRLKVIR